MIFWTPSPPDDRDTVFAGSILGHRFTSASRLFCRGAAGKFETSELEGGLEMAGAAAHEFSQALHADADFLSAEARSDDPDVNETLASVKGSVVQLAERVGKVQRITRYESVNYSSSQMIVDIDKVSRKPE